MQELVLWQKYKFCVFVCDNDEQYSQDGASDQCCDISDASIKLKPCIKSLEILISRLFFKDWVV